MTSNALVTYFRRGKIQKFFLATNETETTELDFITTAGLLESAATDKRQKLPEGYFELLDRNKEAFIHATTEDMIEIQARRGRDSAYQILKIMKAVFRNTQTLTEEQEEYAQTVMARLEAGGLPKETTARALKALKALGNQAANPLKALAALQTAIPPRLLEGHFAEQNPRSSGRREVILSMALVGEDLDI